MKKIRYYIKLMRPHHYIKNLLIFAALACSGQLFLAAKFLSALLGFVLFCVSSSVIYIVNDIQDVEKDRMHPAKCRRPIAAGQISIKEARILACFLVLVIIVCCGIVFQPLACFLLLSYLVLNFVYSFGAKNIPLIDICILTSGFLIRVIYGAVITGITVSNWLYLTVITLSFYLAFGKRRNELKRLGDNSTRYALKFYSIDFLDKNMYMCLTLANAFYALWCMDGTTIKLHETQRLIFTVPLILLISMRYSMDVEGNSDGDPVEVLIHDKWILALSAIYFICMFVILYFPSRRL